MKSINRKKPEFTISDFEKGLMLAGYVTPSSISEFRERSELEEYEKKIIKDKNPIYFKRLTLAAEIASQLCEERTFGRVKFQKMVYLCEHAAGMSLQERYTKQAAGPFDNRFMHTVDKEFKNRKWFDVQKITENNITRYKYLPLESIENYKGYYISYFKNTHEKIQFLIDLFRNQKTDFTELAATIYACLIELSTKQQEINSNSLLELFYNWSDSKKRFTENQVIQMWEWLIEKGVIPSETGN